MPYGLSVGYVNLFYVEPRWRRLGFGRLLHDRAATYFRAWDATAVELHVGAGNAAAVGFYRAMGYRLLEAGGPIWKMRLDLSAAPVRPG